MIRTKALKDGYKSELNKRKDALCDVRKHMETWYATHMTVKDETMDETTLSNYSALLAQAESAVVDYMGFIKTLKPNLAPWLQKLYLSHSGSFSFVWFFPVVRKSISLS